MSTMTIPADRASELCYMHSGNEVDGWTWVAEEEGEDRRWSRSNMVVIKDPDGGLWAFDYEEGLTENRDNEYPWSHTDRYDAELKKYIDTTPTEVEVYSVQPLTKTVVEYVAV